MRTADPVMSRRLRVSGRSARARRSAAGRALGAGVICALAAAGLASGAQPAARRAVDPVGEFVPVKPKVFKDLKYVEITDYDKVRATNTGKPRAFVHLKDSSALETPEFTLSGLDLEFSVRDAQGVVYKFTGKFSRGGDLYSLGKTDEAVLHGHLATYLKDELLRQENLHFKFRTGD